MLRDVLELWEAHAERVLAWLGLSVAGWALVLGAERLVHDGGAELGRALLYVLGRALALSVLLGLGVAVAHLARMWLARHGRRGWLALAIGACAVALPAVYQVADSLTEGAWIAEQWYVGGVRVGLIALLLVAWLAVLAFHVIGTVELVSSSSARRARMLRAAWWSFGLGVLAVSALLLPGVLRPYGALAERVLAPGWLLSATLGFQLRARRPELARSVSLVVLACAGGALGATPIEARLVAGPRSRALEGAGFCALTELRTHPGTPDTGRFDFATALRDARCPAAQRLLDTKLPAGARRNVILLSIDTVRKDAIGKRYGERAVAPSLEAFARRSIAFERAVAPASITTFSLGSALTGYSVPQLLWAPSPPPNVFTRTRAVLDRQLQVLPDWDMMRSERVAALLHQGASAKYVSRGKDPVKPFLAALEDARASAQRGLFWLHLVDPHAPYSAHRGFDFGSSPLARYHGEVAFADAQIGRTLQRIEELGYFEDSLIVVFSDHGESLGEGGYFGHGVSMAARFTDVPLYVRYPGVEPRRSHAAVTLSSLAATVLHFLDLDVPGTLQRCSLLLPERALALCAPPASTTFGLETRAYDRVRDDPVRDLADLERRQRDIERWRRFNADVALTTPEHRLLFDLRTGHGRIYDRAADPRERHDLFDERPELVRAFRARLAQWRAEEVQRIVCGLQASTMP